MGALTDISWADDTFNPWVGCMKVSPACDGCYAEHLVQNRMHRVIWGAPGYGPGQRDRTSPANWRKPLKWNAEALIAKAAWLQGGSVGPEPRRLVFCASLADVFDNEVPTEWRRDLFDLIRATPHLTWLLLTKRPQLIERLYGEAHLDLPDGGSGYDWPQNAWAGTTVEDAPRANRNLLALARAASQLGIPLTFLSAEPLLEGFDLFNLEPGAGIHFDALAGVESVNGRAVNFWRPLGWVISGGETDQGKHKARPPHPGWFRSLRDQCAAAGVPFHFKQWGEWREAGPGDEFDTALGRAGKPPALIVNPRDGTVHCFLPENPDPALRVMLRVGKKRSGRSLDGVTHDARPVLA